jgi:murein DD-endopeptidase MepM/ murein hydrolase activator NlpD
VGGGDVSVVAGSALVAQDGPSGTVADIEARPPASAVSVYVVRAGDNISTIADMYDVSVNTIKWANDLKTGTIHEGQTLVILPVSGVYHTVKAGDTVASLAKKYKADEDEIREHNDLSGELAAGAKLLIPNGTIAAAPAPAKAVVRTGSGAGATVSAGGPAIAGYYGNPVPGGVLTQGVHGYNGIDIGAPAGTPIYASAGGTVVVAIANGGYNGGYGNYVVVQHPNGTQTLYAHMSRVSVGSGTSVEKGTQIGTVGNTGKSTGNHLHFEVRGAANPFAH